MAEKLGARKNSSWKAICTAPDFCKTPVGSSTPPIPYQVIADLGQSAKTVPNVRFNGDPCKVLDQSIVPKCTGDEPGTAKGVKSGTVADKVEPTSASTTVRSTKKRVVRHLDTCTLNSGSCPGIYTTQPSPGAAVATGGKPTPKEPAVTPDTPKEVQAAQEGKGIWGMVSGPVHFVLGAAGFIPGLGAVPDLLDAGVYALEGDMISAGISAAAAVPFAGDAVKAGTIIGKAGKQLAKETAERLAKEAAERAAKEAAEKTAREAAERAAREAAERKAKHEAGEASASSVKKGDGVKVKGKGKGPCDHLKKGNGKGPYRGGAHSETSKPKNDGKDSHHMPADDVSPLPRKDGPAIQMDPADHRETLSNGSGIENKQFRKMVEGLLNKREWRKALALEIRDVRKIAREAGDPRKYNEAMKEMLEYFKCLEANGLL
jgi:histone H3/H4